VPAVLTKGKTMGSTPKFLSASQGAGILGVSDFNTQVTAWLNIMERQKPGFCAEHGYEKPKPPNDVIMKWGHDFEDPIIIAAQELRNEFIVDREKYFCKQDFVTCHIDGQYEDGPLHEGKTTNFFSYVEKWGAPGSDMVPIDYQIQCQHQMYCSDTEKNIITVAVFPLRQQEFEDRSLLPPPTKDGIIEKERILTGWMKTLYEMGLVHQYEINRNDELIEKMVN
jgi:hypothetical protein